MTRISKFPKYNKPPKTTTLAKFVRATMDPNNKLAKQVMRYRQTGEAHLKETLPLITAGALLTGKRNEDKYSKPGAGYRVKQQIKERTGWIALDIDAGDNPHLDDAEAVRDAVGRLPFVSFSALSVSGKGVWALVKIEDPEKQAKHFEQLKKDFQYYGITLDPTKGKHAHDLRYYSFDPDAVINKDFNVYDRLPQEKPKPTRPSVEVPKIENTDKYAEVALNDELETLSRTANGNRNNQLFKSSAALAQLVAGGVLNKSEVANALYHTARSIGLPKYEIETTINSGFRAGMKNPRQPSKNEQPKPLRRKDSGSNGEYKTKDFKKFSDSLNEIKPPEKGTQEHAEATRHMINDASEDELEELCRRDPTVAKMMDMFDGQVQDTTNLLYNQ